MRRHRKLRLLLGLFLAFTLLAAACGDDSDSESGGSDDTSTDGGDGGDGGEDAISVGLVYDLGGRGDQSFNDAAAEGLDRAAEELGVEVNELEPSAGGEDREELLRLLAEDGNDLVIGVGFAFEESLASAAEDFPDTTFAIVDSENVTADNIANLVFAEEQGSFLVGAAAALTSESGQIGFVGGVDTELIQKFQAGYEAGAAEIDPSITVDSQYLTQPPNFDGFNDPQAGEEVAGSMFEDGADVVYHASGGSGSGVFEAAAANDGLAIGVDSDQYLTADPSLQEVILTSMLKQVGVAVFDTIEAANSGDAPSGITRFDLSNDGIGYSTSGDFLAQDVIDQLEDLKQQIIDGDIEVPTTP